jgi:hypothetical protein
MKVPDIAFPAIDINKAATDINNAVKETAYVAVGLGVLGFQKVQVQRVELTKQIEAQLGSLPTSINTRLEAYLGTAREQATSAREQIADQLSDLSRSVEGAFSPARAQLSRAIPTEIPGIPDFGHQLTATAERIEAQLETARAQLVEFAKSVDERVAPARQQIDEQIDRLEQALPVSARTVVQSVRSTATAQEQALRSAVGLD